MGQKIFWHGRTYDTNSLENLVPFNKMPKEQHREISRRGGIASGEKRRKKSALVKLCKIQLEKAFLAEGVTKQELDDFRRWQQEQRKQEHRSKRDLTKKKSRTE